MSMFQIFHISGSAVSAQSQRLNTVASNLANVDTVAGPDGSAYKARQVVFQTHLMGSREGGPADGASGVALSSNLVISCRRLPGNSPMVSGCTGFSKQASRSRQRRAKGKAA